MRANFCDGSVCVAASLRPTLGLSKARLSSLQFTRSSVLATSPSCYCIFRYLAAPTLFLPSVTRRRLASRTLFMVAWLPSSLFNNRYILLYFSQHYYYSTLHAPLNLTPCTRTKHSIALDLQYPYSFFQQRSTPAASFAMSYKSQWNAFIWCQNEELHHRGSHQKLVRMLYSF